MRTWITAVTCQRWYVRGSPGQPGVRKAPQALAAIVLRDSAYLQEEDAENARLWGFSRHDPPRPLYNAADAEKATTSFRPLDYHQRRALQSGAHLVVSTATIPSVGSMILASGTSSHDF